MTERKRPITILVADDDVGITSVLSIELERENYDVQTCDNGLAAVERIMSWKPHLVVLDYQMPGLDGRAVCSRIRRIHHGTGLTSAVRILLISYFRAKAGSTSSSTFDELLGQTFPSRSR